MKAFNYRYLSAILLWKTKQTIKYTIILRPPKTKKFQKTLPNLKIAAHYRHMDCNHSVPDFCFTSCTNMFSISRVARYNETNKKTSNRGQWSNHHQKGLTRSLLLLYIKVITTHVALLTLEVKVEVSEMKNT